MAQGQNPLEMIATELLAELDQLDASTHYFSDLPTTDANYQDQWRTTTRLATEIRLCVERLVEELARQGSSGAGP